MLLLGLAVWAADMTGRWELDRAASEDMDTLLQETQELSWLERQLAGSVDVTHVIAQQGATVQVDVVAPAFTSSATLVTDKQWRDATLRTGPASQRAWWEGEVLVVESKGSLADGTSALYRTERWIEGDDMFFVLSIDAEDGRSWKVKRVLRRS